MKTYTVYRLRHVHDTNCRFNYIGITSNWPVRKYQHKRRCNDQTDMGYNWKVYQYIRRFGGIKYWKMEALETFECNNDDEKKNKEIFWI